MSGARTRPTTTYWQRLLDDWPDGIKPRPPYRFDYPVRLPDGRVLVLPLRELPEGGRAVASLIANQASFGVVSALADHMADLARTSRDRHRRRRADARVGVRAAGGRTARA